MDRFIVETADLGKLFKVHVRHDNSALLGSDWYLDRIEISSNSDKEKYIFLCDRWLSTSKEDKVYFILKIIDKLKSLKIS
jgi:hypothetical protein